SVQGALSFPPFSLGKQRKWGRPLGETKVSMQGAAAVKVSHLYIETKPNFNATPKKTLQNKILLL
ncbi:hypothetical protein QV02_08605, partial [Gallibacterium anatis]